MCATYTDTETLFKFWASYSGSDDDKSTKFSIIYLRFHPPIGDFQRAKMFL